MRLLFKILFSVMALAIGIYGLSHYWIHLNDPNPFMQKFYGLNTLLVYSHFVGGGLALLLGALQIWTTRPSRLHRWLGLSYCSAIAVAAIGGCYLALHTHLGAVTGVGFFIADVLWLVTTGMAIRCAWQHKIAAHRRWILRSLALTGAALSLRLLLPTFNLFFSFETSYILVAWLSWSINLVIIEIYLWAYPRTQSRLFTPIQPTSDTRN